MVRGSIEVKARELDQVNARVQIRVGRARNDVNDVTCVDERKAEVTKIDPLATAVRIAAITQQRNAQGFNSTFWRNCRGTGGGPSLSFQDVIPERMRGEFKAEGRVGVEVGRVVKSLLQCLHYVLG